MESNKIWLLLLILVLYLAYNDSLEKEFEITPQNIYQFVDSGIVFTGQNKFVSSSSLSKEAVRVLKMKENGVEDLGYKSMDKGILNTKPGDIYKLYYFMNTTPSTSYYIQIEEYTAPSVESAENKVGFGCEIDNDLSFTSYDSNERAQTATTNAISISASSTADISIKIRVHADKCYGMPDSPKGNAVCFSYNSNAFSKIETPTSHIGAPYTISKNETSGTLSCYEFPLLADSDSATIPVVLTSGSTDPTAIHNITVFSEDIGFDLNQDDLSEIYDYNDEDGNSVGSSTYKILGRIYVS